MEFTIQQLRQVRPQIEQWILATERQREDADPAGALSGALQTHYANMAICNYRLDHDVNSFRDNLRRCGILQLELLKRSREGEDIYRPYVDISSYPILLYTLASQDWELACRIANSLDGKVHDQFHAGLGNLIKFAILDDFAEASRSLAILEGALRPPNANGFYRYFDSLIHKKDDFDINESLSYVENTYREHCNHEHGMFGGTPHALLCLWGIGLAYLAIHTAQQINLAYDSEFIPLELICGTGGTPKVE